MPERTISGSKLFRLLLYNPIPMPKAMRDTKEDIWSVSGQKEASLKVDLRNALEAHLKQIGYKPTGEEIEGALNQPLSIWKKYISPYKLIVRLVTSAHTTEDDARTIVKQMHAKTNGKQIPWQLILPSEAAHARSELHSRRKYWTDCITGMREPDLKREDAVFHGQIIQKLKDHWNQLKAEGKPVPEVEMLETISPEAASGLTRIHEVEIGVRKEAVDQFSNGDIDSAISSVASQLTGRASTHIIRQKAAIDHIPEIADRIIQNPSTRGKAVVHAFGWLTAPGIFYPDILSNAIDIESGKSGDLPKMFIGKEGEPILDAQGNPIRQRKALHEGVEASPVYTKEIQRKGKPTLEFQFVFPRGAYVPSSGVRIISGLMKGKTKFDKTDLARSIFENMFEHLLRDNIPDTYERLGIGAETSQKLNYNDLKEFSQRLAKHTSAANALRIPSNTELGKLWKEGYDKNRNWDANRIVDKLKEIDTLRKSHGLPELSTSVLLLYKGNEGHLWGMLSPEQKRELQLQMAEQNPAEYRKWGGEKMYGREAFSFCKPGIKDFVSNILDRHRDASNKAAEYAFIDGDPRTHALVEFLQEKSILSPELNTKVNGLMQSHQEKREAFMRERAKREI